MSFGCQSLGNTNQALPAGIQKKESLVLKDSDLKSVLEYDRHLLSLSEEELNREYAHNQQTFSESDNSVDRLQLILLLSLPSATFKDYDRSLTLLNDYLNNSIGQDSTLNDFLFLLSFFIQELKNQDERYQKLDQMLGEEKKQRELLQQKLEELTTIEKNLQERNNNKDGKSP